jgi:hypothetical protein
LRRWRAGVEKQDQSGVKFVGVVGAEASRIEGIIGELCVGDGSNPYEMLTSSHPEETLGDAVRFARELGLKYSSEVQVVEF